MKGVAALNSLSLFSSVLVAGAIQESLNPMSINFTLWHMPLHILCPDFRVIHQLCNGKCVVTFATNYFFYFEMATSDIAYMPIHCT